MRKSYLFFFVIAAVFVFNGCSIDEDPTNDNPDVSSIQIDSTLKSFFPNTAPNFEIVFVQNFTNAQAFTINFSWFDPTDSHGIYLDFNNNIGDALVDANGFIKSFDSGVKIDSTLAGTWSDNVDGRFSLDYVANPSANKGNLAGQGDKYIIFRAFSDALPQLKYYGWLRVNVSANGRELKVISIGFQKNANTNLRTGEL